MKIIIYFFYIILLICSCQRTQKLLKVNNDELVIKEIIVKDVTDTKATICWITNQPSTSEVIYGSNKDLMITTGEDAVFKTTHTIRLVGLQPSTLYFFKIKSRTENNIIIEGYEGSFTTKKQLINSAPQIPISVEGSKVGVKNLLYSYNVYTIDPDGDMVRFIFNWGDGTTSYTDYVFSGDLAIASHVWTNAGVYNITVKAQDDSGAISFETSPLEVVIFDHIDPPEQPSIVNSPNLGFKGVSYSFYAVANEPNNDKIKYIFDWGDNTITETQFFDSNKTIYAQHKWDNVGDYFVKVKAINRYGISSIWSVPMSISIKIFGKIIQYGFEDGIKGWQIQNLPGNKAVTSIESTDETSHSGYKSMKIFVNLIPGSSDNTKGEVWIDMRYYPPQGYQDIHFPIDLTNKRVICWIKAPPEAFGEETHANGVQILFKDNNWYSRFSEFTIIHPTNDWFKVEDVVNKITPYRGFVDNNFDPSKIQVIGIKIGLGEQSQTPYQGVIYIDDIYFEE